MRIANFARKSPSFWRWILLAIGLLFTTITISLAIGSVYIAPSQQFAVLMHQFSIELPEFQHIHELIVLQIRLPRVILSAVVGFALALSGTVMQGVLRNPLADPYLLGIASGATTGAAAVIALGWGNNGIALPLGAFCGGLLAISLVYSLAQSTLGRLATYTLILAGMAISAAFAAITSFLIFMSADDQLRQVVLWMMGSLAGADWEYIPLLMVVIITTSSIILLFARDLNALAIGEEMATHLGIRTQYLQKLFLLLTTILTAAVVCVAGTIGFVGLLVPHAMRLLIGADHRLLLPMSALAGAIFLTVCDTLARTVLSPVELPVGIITALCGAPFFLYLLKSRSNYSPH